MLTNQLIADLVLKAVKSAGIDPTEEEAKKIRVEYPDYSFGDYSSNAALILSKRAHISPKILAEKIIGKIDKNAFESVKPAGLGFINFRIKTAEFLHNLSRPVKQESLLLRGEGTSGKILLEYFQPNIAKPLHVGHLRTAIIGDCLKRMLIFAGLDVESETHMGDWGTQFGLLLLAYKKYGDLEVVRKDPVNELNKLYIKVNQEIESDPSLHEAGKQEFAKLEKGDAENRKIWKQFVDWSMEKFLEFDKTFGVLPFDHHWPESFYEDKMPAVLAELKSKNLLVESEGAWIVNLEPQKLGVAIIVKSDGATTYLLRDLATFIFRKEQGFTKQLYVVDSRQAYTLQQTFEILRLMGKLEEGEAVHIDYGFLSFKGTALSTRKGNIVLAEELINQAKEKVAKIIAEKNPGLKDKEKTVGAVAKGAIKYFDLSHNRHSDIEFDWKEALDFEGNSGPYLQYAYARLASILRKAQPTTHNPQPTTFSETERRILFLLSIFDEKVGESLQDFLPNLFVNYLYELAGLINKFYHESPVLKEENKELKEFRLQLVKTAKNTLKKGLDLLGIETLEEM